MKYSQARHLLKSGDVLAWCGTGPISRLIAHVTGGQYTHVGIVWCDNNRIFVLQDKEWKGICLAAASEMPFPCDWIQTGLLWTEETRKLAFEHMGKRYDYLAALDVGFGLMPRSSQQVCSLYVGDLVTQMGLPCLRKGLTPQALVDILLNNGSSLNRLTNLGSFDC